MTDFALAESVMTSVQEMSEMIRSELIALRLRNVSAYPREQFRPFMFDLARVLRNFNVFYATRDGNFFGYGNLIGEGGFYAAIQKGSLLEIYGNVSDMGEISTGSHPAVSFPYNATIRPWFPRTVFTQGLVVVHDPYTFANGVVGCTLSFAIFADLKAPPFAFQLPAVPRNFGASNMVEVVVGIDIQLDALSTFLQNVKTPVKRVLFRSFLFFLFKDVFRRVQKC